MATKKVTTTKKKTDRKGAASKAAKKAPAKKKTAPIKGKTETKEKKQTAKATGGLRKPQVRVLETLSKESSPLSRKEISEKASVDHAALTEYLGSSNPEVRAKNDAKHFPSLLTLGFITLKDDGLYQITPAGRKASATD